MDGKVFPNEKPLFLFDDIERSTHTAISADAYHALKAEHDKLEKRLENAKSEYKKLRGEKDAIELERDSLRAMVERMKTPDERAVFNCFRDCQDSGFKAGNGRVYPNAPTQSRMG